MPKLSVLLPFRDAEATLPSCLDSITAQCFGDFELLAVNDHSNDTPRRLVAALAVRDRPVRLLDNPRAGGW